MLQMAKCQVFVAFVDIKVVVLLLLVDIKLVDVNVLPGKVVA